MPIVCLSVCPPLLALAYFDVMVQVNPHKQPLDAQLHNRQGFHMASCKMTPRLFQAHLKVK